MKAIFVELPPFERHRPAYFSDESFRTFQNLLIEHPDAGDVIEGTGGLRKIRHADEKRGKGKRGGLRIVIERSRGWSLHHHTIPTTRVEHQI